jgi:hypothetical protein
VNKLVFNSNTQINEHSSEPGSQAVGLFVLPIFVLLFIPRQIFGVEHVTEVNKFYVIILSTQPGSQRTLSVVQNSFTLN